MRMYVVDTVATIVFFTVIAASFELFVAGMEPRQVLATRAMMIPLMMATGRPYGIWRNWLFAQVLPERQIAKAVLDSVAFLSFQLPVYAATLVLAGADPRQIVTLLAATAVAMVLVSRPFGLFLDAARRLAVPR